VQITAVEARQSSRDQRRGECGEDEQRGDGELGSGQLGYVPEG
jgi:hypothetical protein